ncbi:hypothetical protein C0993_006937 [Termitomyces sp. T159_Od127]|nr:hypothetical protein C0993_006937 [Termitomyces sp. T159_Od127]
MLAGEKEGGEKQVAISAWTFAESDASSRCGHCDNCQRSPEEVVHKDVTLQAWQLVKIAKALNDSGENVTLESLAALARGNVSRKTRQGQTRENHKLYLEEVAGGEVDMTRDDIEHLLVDLVLQGYLEEKYRTTPYLTDVFVECGPRASVLSQHTQQSLATEHDLKIESVFRRKERKSKVSREKSKASARSKAKGKRRRSTTDSEDGEDELYDDDDDDNVEGKTGPPMSAGRMIKENNLDVLVLSDN